MAQRLDEPQFFQVLDTLADRVKPYASNADTIQVANDIGFITEMTPQWFVDYLCLVIWFINYKQQNAEACRGAHQLWEAYRTLPENHFSS